MANHEKGHPAMLKKSALIGLSLLIAPITGVCASAPVPESQHLAKCHGIHATDELNGKGLNAYGPQTSMENVRKAAQLEAVAMVGYATKDYASVHPMCLKAETWAFKNPKLVSMASLFAASKK